MHIRHGRWVVYKALAAEKSVLPSQLIYFIAKVLISSASVAARSVSQRALNRRLHLLEVAMAARVLLLAVVVLSARAVPDQTYNDFLAVGEYIRGAHACTNYIDVGFINMYYCHLVYLSQSCIYYR